MVHPAQRVRQAVRRFLCLALSALGIAALATPAPAEEAPQKQKGQLTFEHDIRPILKVHCTHCHGEAGEKEGGLDLRLRWLMVQGGDSGPAITPGDAEASYLIERIEAGEMPPGDAPKMPKEQLALLRRWIDQGAPTAGPEPKEVGPGPIITQAEREFWAFRPVRRPKPPGVKTAQRVRTPVDAFVLARLEAAGLSLAPEADRRTLIRRLYFDLLGLVPPPEEVERFVNDPSPQAYEKLVDRLLASPQYGERWARHWLDVAGYADSEGYTNEDPERPWAWKYRDYVIRSLNADKPLDQFIVEQLAGDELLRPPYKELSPQEAELLAATGFLRMAPDGTGGSVDQPLARNAVISETIKIVSSALLGLTVGCAECHDHKYDPIPQEDYYRLRAIFEPAYDSQRWRTPRQRLISLYTQADRKKAQQIEQQAKQIDQKRLKRQKELIEQTLQRELAKLPEELRKPLHKAYYTPANKRTAEQKELLKKYPKVGRLTPGSLYLYDRKAADELKKLAAEAKKVRDKKPKEQFVRAMTEVPGQVPVTRLFYRGDYRQPRQEVQPGPLRVLLPPGEKNPVPVDDPKLPTTGRRLAYARWLTSGRHPLVARVLVNRVWMHYFGRGIVATPEDFGHLGARPTHPQLLDWLADELVRSGWRLKHLHRLIVTSSVYRQQSRISPKAQQVDPDNRLLSHMPLRRLDAEALRDGVLAVSGKLNLEMFGPPVPVMADRVGQFVLGIENLNAGRPGPRIPLHGREYRRSVYVQARRSRPLAVLKAFDWPAMEPNCPRRASSTVSTQALMLMNNEFLINHAHFFAQRVVQEAGSEPQAQVRRAWLLAYGREPDPQEMKLALDYLKRQAEVIRGRKAQVRTSDSKVHTIADAELLALASLCQVLLGSNEFLYVE